MTEIYRQGDVILVPVNKPTGLIEKLKPDGERTILAYGEVTGHAHALPAKAAHQYTAGSGGKTYVNVTEEKAVLKHEEHAPVELPKGHYEKIIAREYTPGGERQVAD